MESLEKSEILNDEFVSKELMLSKPRKKIKIALALIAALAIITTTTLLVGYFKFDWFKDEIYKVDAQISRKVYQANYFSQTKTSNFNIGFTSGVKENNLNEFYTNFVVLQTDRKELGNNDFLNTATLVILDAKAKSENEIKEGISFNPFDENIISEVKANPDGSKYPIAIFSFYENGTIADIKMPNNMNSANAYTILDLIESVVPKLSRNRTEDISNGLNIRTKKDKSKKTLVEIQSPKEITEFKGSRFTKSVERDIDDGRLTNIRTQSSLDLDDDEENTDETFGLKDFFYDEKSEIVSTSTTEEKESAELIQNLVQYFTFIDSKELIKSLEKEEVETVVEEYEEDLSQNSELRNLDFSKFNADKTYTIKTFKVLKVKIEFKVKIGVSNGKAYAKLVISTNLGDASFGTDGIKAAFSKTFSTGDKTIFKFVFPPIPAISVSLKAGGSLTIKVNIDTAGEEKLNISITGSIYAKCEISVNILLASVSGGAQGTILSATLGVKINKGKGFTKYGSISAGKVVVYVKWRVLWKKKKKEWTVFNGWTANF